MVVALGDLCSQTGTREEYETVKTYFSKLKHSLFPITGNHDFIYEDDFAEDLDSYIERSNQKDEKGNRSNARLF